MNQLFRYSIKKDATTYYYVSNGVVLTTDVPTYLNHYPKEWEETEILFKRDTLFWGVFIEMSQPYDFVWDGAKIVRHIYYTEGSEGAAILSSEILNSTSQQYEFFYEGDIDFSQTSDAEDLVSSNIFKRGISELLISRQDTPYEIPLDDPAALTMLFDGVLVQSEGAWYPGNYSSEAANGVLFSTIPYSLTSDTTNPIGRTVPFYNNGEVLQISPFVRPHSQKGRVIAPALVVVDYPFISGTPSIDDGEYMLYANTALTNVKIDGQMVFSAIMPDVVGLKTIRIIATVVVKTDPPFMGIVSQHVLYTFTSTAVDTGVGALASLQGTFDMPANTYLVISIKGECPALSASEEFDAFFPIENGSMKITYLAKVAPSETKCLRYIDFVNRLVSKLSDGAASVVSNYLSNPNTSPTNRFKNWDMVAYWNLVTSGNSLRGLPDSVIKATMGEAYTDMYGRMNQVLCVEGNNIRVEEMAYVFQDVLIATIDKTNEMSVSDYKDKMFNNVKTGYGVYDNRNVVGKNEFNTEVNYLADTVRRYKKEDTTQTGFRADVYGIESTRSETLNQSRADNRSDNDTFVTEADPTPVAGKYVVYRPTGTITGVDDPINIYNVTLSPGRNIRRHLRRLRSLVSRGTLRFQSKDKNQELVSTFTSGQVVEAGDIPMDNDIYNGHDVSPLFLPYVFDFTCKPPFNLYNLATANPLGYIAFDYYGTPMKGFILELSLLPATGACRLKLLSHPGNDLTKMIR
jgi:hypothetical protein